jgi:hypothetical protein
MRTPSNHQSIETVVPEPCRVVAHFLATELARAVGADPQHRNELIGTALTIGEWLADQGLPGRWDRVVPAKIILALGPISEEERASFLLSLVALVGYAGLNRYIPVRSASAILDQTDRATDSEVIRLFVRSTQRQLAQALA